MVNVQQAKAHLSRLIERAAAGEEILLGKHGKPMARLSAHAPDKEERRVGGLEGRIRVAEDFDDEDPRIAAMFEGACRATSRSLLDKRPTPGRSSGP